jgi:replicative DNA helicase
MDIERSCHSFVKGHGVDIIFIDYLQRITAPGRTKWEEVSAATRTITNLSRELNVPIVCMAQTSREADHEPPQISHFQHSSQIEQDADVAIVIQHKYACGCGRCGSDNTDCPERKEASDLSVLKNRDGDVDHVPVIFDRDYVTFV